MNATVEQQVDITATGLSGFGKSLDGANWVIAQDCGEIVRQHGANELPDSEAYLTASVEHGAGPESGVIVFMPVGTPRTVRFGAVSSGIDVASGTRSIPARYYYRRSRDPGPSETDFRGSSRNYPNFILDIVRMLDDVPLEDGMLHPADSIVAHQLCVDKGECISSLDRAFRGFLSSRPQISAAILRLVGRLDYVDVGRSGMSLARAGLGQGDVEIREAAVRALENWGGAEATRLLRNHRDAEPWISDYVKQVIADLGTTRE